MHPVLFRIGPVTVNSFGVMIALAIVAGAYAAWRVLKARGVAPEFGYELVFTAGVAGLVGGRIYYVAQHWSEVRNDLWSGLFGGTGFTWYGALLGGALLVTLHSAVRRVPLGLVANAAGVGVALGYAIGRIGCQLAGDGDYGKPSDLPWAMGYAHGTVPTPPGVRVQPTPVYETLIMLAVFWVLWRMAKKPQPGYYVFAWFLLLSGIERLLIEFVRRNPIWIWGLTAPQWISIGVIVTGVIGIFVYHTHPKIEMVSPPPTRSAKRT